MHLYLGSDETHQMVTFVDEQGNPIIIMQGTQGDSDMAWVDITEDVALGVLPMTQAQADALAYLDTVYERYGRDVVVAGHSLGGNLAQFVTIASPHVMRCVSFDAPGFSQAFLSFYSLLIGLRRGKITAYANYKDNVHTWLFPIVGCVMIYGDGDDSQFYGAHSMNSFFDFYTDENGTHLATSSDGAYMVRNMKQIRDFSEEKLQELLGIIDAINGEQWWDVSHWDIWYRIEDANILNLGRPLNPAYYQDDMTSYYRKVMDVNDTTPEQVRRIFESARSRDGAYASTIRGVCQRVAECTTQMNGFLE